MTRASETANPSLFALTQWRIKARFWRFFGGAYDITSPGIGQVGYATVAALKLREDIRLYDRKAGVELLRIKARNIIDFSGRYDVTDSLTGQIIGGFLRKGMSSIVRDHWQVLDPNGEPIGSVYEDSVKLALLRRLLLGGLLPQRFVCDIGDEKNTQPASVFQQRFYLFRPTMDINMTASATRPSTSDPSGIFDARMALACGLLLSAIEGSQHD